MSYKSYTTSPKGYAFIGCEFVTFFIQISRQVSTFKHFTFLFYSSVKNGSPTTNCVPTAHKKKGCISNFESHSINFRDHTTTPCLYINAEQRSGCPTKRVRAITNLYPVSDDPLPWFIERTSINTWRRSN